jgi:hypothetical protein
VFEDVEGTFVVEAIPSKCARFGIKSFELCEAIFGSVWNVILYNGQDTVFTASAT